jgi:distribution and morphology protein 34
LMPSPSGTAGTAGTATAGSVTARASSVRSSIGGSTLGLGMANSWAGGHSKRDFVRHHALTRLVGGPTSRNSSGRSEIVSPLTSRPGVQRKHSRAESVPGQLVMHGRPSRLNHSVTVSGAGQRTSISSMDTLAGGPSHATHYSTGATSQLPSSRPVSMAAYPGAKTAATPRSRRLSATFQPFQSGSPPYPSTSYPPKHNAIVLPLNDSVSQLATLSHSNHTLSPYARTNEHVAVRSFPRLSRVNTSSVGPGTPLAGPAQLAAPNGPDSRLVRAKRKRMFKLGGRNKNAAAENAPEEDVFLDDPVAQEPSRRSSASSDPHVHPQSLGQAAMRLAKSSTAGKTSVARTRPSLSARNSYGFPARGSLM